MVAATHPGIPYLSILSALESPGNLKVLGNPLFLLILSGQTRSLGDSAQDRNIREIQHQGHHRLSGHEHP